MTSAHPATEAWAEWWRKLDVLNAALRKLSLRGTTHISAADIRDAAKDVAQFYFREVRQRLVELGIDSEQIAWADSEMQDVIELAVKVNRTTAYKRVMRLVGELRVPLETAIEIAIAAKDPASRVLAPTEAAILKTLDQLVPTTALSYQQVLRDLNDSTRVSYRGTGSELREVLRELLDHLAPDAAVMGTPGFKLEKDHTKPTMKQKAVFILKARGTNETKRKTATDATEAVEGAVGSLARSVYTRGSLSTHIATTRTEVLTFKGYADAVLAELLEIHK